VDNHITAEHPDPLPADPYSSMKPSRKRPAVRALLPAKPNKTIRLSESLHTSAPSTGMTASTSEQEACEALLLLGSSSDVDMTTTNQHDYGCPEQQLQATSPIRHHTGEETTSAQPAFLVVHCKQCGYDNICDKNDMATIQRQAFVAVVCRSDANCLYYTGVHTVALLQFLFEWLQPGQSNMKLWDGDRKGLPKTPRGRKRALMTLKDEFIMTLVRIRQGFDMQHLADLFGISKSHVCRIFSAWVIFLHARFKMLLVWPSQVIVRSNLPASFKQYPKTRCIIDCTEYFVQRPFRPVAQKQTWSSYKHSNTFKQLIGIMPTGTITFVSKLYSGNISDLAIVQQSKFIDLVESDDDIMADRGFNIRHLLLPKKATLNIPAFSHGKRLSVKAVQRSRQIATVRFHVERAIRRMKTFKILSGIIPLRLRHSLNQITVIVAVLCNLHERLA